MYSVASSLNSSFAVVSHLAQSHESVKPLHQPENYYQWQEYFKLLHKFIDEKQNRDRDKNSTFTIIIIIAKIRQRKYYNRYYTAKGRKEISN